jgi:LPS O-antigen subunit length determinant protein (WzzB/FepE family)
LPTFASTMSALKNELLQRCITYVQNRIDNAQQAIQSAQQASNDDTKSSAGDKYETSREMMQQDTNRNIAQLTEASKLMVALNRININGTSTTAESGSLVITNNGKFFLAISAGTLTIEDQPYFAISVASPIGALIKGKKAGEQFTLNGKTYSIESVL